MKTSRSVLLLAVAVPLAGLGGFFAGLNRDSDRPQTDELVSEESAIPPADRRTDRPTAALPRTPVTPAATAPFDADEFISRAIAIAGTQNHPGRMRELVSLVDEIPVEHLATIVARARAIQDQRARQSVFHAVFVRYADLSPKLASEHALTLDPPLRHSARHTATSA